MGTQIVESLLALQENGLKCCYICPPIGLYYEHPSGTHPDAAGRKPILAAHWDASWVQGGTRPEKDIDWPRSLCRLTRRGPMEIVTTIDLPAALETAWWCTQAPSVDWPLRFVWSHPNASAMEQAISA